jgi:organic radical activating enzyme
MNANNPKIPQILWDYHGASVGPELTLEEYKKMFRDLEHWRPVISIGGGEPMTFPPMIELIAFLKR